MNCKRHLRQIFYAVKATLFLFLLLLLFGNAFTLKAENKQTLLEQKITITLQGEKLTVCLKKISELANVKFSYTNSIINEDKKVWISVKNKELKEVLDQLLMPVNIKYEVVNGYIILTKKTSEQITRNIIAAIKVSGVVTDELGVPMPDVSVTVKGTNLGTKTGTNGRFELDVESGAVLIFSFTGYENVEMPATANMNIQLKKTDSQMEEVVVVGYGTQKKVNLTGAVATVGAKQFENRPVTNVTQALQGQVASLNISASSGSPDATPNINIRGWSGLGTTNPPLVVIDGIPGGNLNRINPSDIESISILKDAASAAIYGQDGAYGVILVTTKVGKAGKVRVSYNNNFAFASVINMPKMLNSLEFATIYNEACVNASRGNIFSDATIAKIREYQNGEIQYETGANPNGSNEWLSWGSSWGNNDWFKEFFKKNVFSQQHNIGVNGGSEKMNFYIGAGYNDRGGMYNYGNDDYDRYNFRVNLGSKITDWMKINLRSSFSREVSNTPNTFAGRTGGNYMHQLARKWPTVPLKDSLGNYSETSDVMLQENGGRIKQSINEMITTGEVQLNPLKGWNIVANYTFNLGSRMYSAHQRALYETRPNGALVLINNTSPSSFLRSTNEATTQTVNAYTSYEKQIGDHYFKVLGGFMQNDYRYTYFNGSNSYTYTDDIPSLMLTYNPTPSVTDTVNTLASQGFFGRINYNYKEKVLLEVNSRYDASSRFLKGYRWILNPGFSAAYILSKENYWDAISPYINTFKIRGSYASLGDQTAAGYISYYPFYPSMGTNSANNTNWIFGGTSREAYVSPPGLVNPELTWVNPVSIGAGVDMTFLNNRLSASFDWFRRRTKDLIVPGATLPSVAGVAAPYANRAEIEVNGVELSLEWKDRIGSVSYQVRGVLSDYKGKVIKNPANSTKQLIVNNSTGYYDGMTLGEIWGYQTVGLFQSADEVSKSASQIRLGNNWGPGDVHYADLNGDNEITPGTETADNPGDMKVIGNKTPRYSYGVTLSAQWKGFDVALFIQGVGKADAAVGSNYFWGITGDEWQSSPFTVQYNNRWTPETPNGYYPKFYMNTGMMNKNNRTQTRYLQNAAYMRLKNLQLGYSIPSKYLEKAKLSDLKFFFSVDNLFTSTKFVKTIDPEFYNSDGKIYPLQRTFSFGINLSL